MAIGFQFWRHVAHRPVGRSKQQSSIAQQRAIDDFIQLIARERQGGLCARLFFVCFGEHAFTLTGRAPHPEKSLFTLIDADVRFALLAKAIHVSSARIVREGEKANIDTQRLAMSRTVRTFTARGLANGASDGVASGAGVGWTFVLLRVPLLHEHSANARLIM